MVMCFVGMVVMMTVAAVSAPFGLERSLYLRQLRPEAMQHFLDHMVGPNAKNLVSNFSRQMPISEMPSKTHKLMRIFVSDLDNRLRGGLNFQPPPIFQLQTPSVGHGNRFRKVEKDIFPLIRSQPNAASMAGVKIESESSCRFFFRPVSGGAINGCVLHSHRQYRK